MSTPNTHEGPARIKACLADCAYRHLSVFFIGVGGVMMSSLALLTAQEGYTVYGSDRTQTPLTDALTEAGLLLRYGHAPQNLPEDCGLVVYTVAISEDNPEYVEAQRRGLPLVSRADYLGALMTDFEKRIGIAGMHGKSTCTSMCAQILLETETDPTILSGATYPPMGGAYRLGVAKELFLFEACEYMDSFLDFNPTVAVLLGAEWEHVDYFKDMEQIIDSFARFASLTGREGVTVVNADDHAILTSARRALEQGGTGRLVTFSPKGDPAADLYPLRPRLEAGLPCFELMAHGRCLGTIAMSVPGHHQIANALAAAAAMEACGIPEAAILSGLSHYQGAGRRMELKGHFKGAAVYDDYGHHPTEVKATLQGAKALCQATSREGRLFCVFQPHTYSRTGALYPDFLSAFDAADRLLLLDIYAAREEPLPGVSSEGLARDINQNAPSKALYCPSPTAAAETLHALVKAGDMVVIMGAGDVTRVTRALLT